MIKTPNEHALDGALWANSAARDLMAAATAVAVAGANVARDIDREDTDFALATQAVEDAWKVVTEKALINLSRAREKFVSAREAAIKEVD